jgi:hypothetical protein
MIVSGIRMPGITGIELSGEDSTNKPGCDGDQHLTSRIRV